MMRLLLNFAGGKIKNRYRSGPKGVWFLHVKGFSIFSDKFFVVLLCFMKLLN
jgi:hypothetical protein